MEQLSEAGESEMNLLNFNYMALSRGADSCGRTQPGAGDAATAGKGYNARSAGPLRGEFADVVAALGRGSDQHRTESASGPMLMPCDPCAADFHSLRGRMSKTTLATGC